MNKSFLYTYYKPKDPNWTGKKKYFSVLSKSLRPEPYSTKTLIMKDFMFLFRFPNLDQSKIPPAEFQALAKKWQDWAGGIAAQGRMSSGGNRLAMEGKVLKPGGVITDGPFVEIRECLGSFIVVKAESLDDATTLAHGCPALDSGGSVEIRPIYG